MADYYCPDCEFVSEGHPTKKAADARGREHQAEHKTGEPAPELTSNQES